MEEPVTIAGDAESKPGAESTPTGANPLTAQPVPQPIPLVPRAPPAPLIRATPPAFPAPPTNVAVHTPTATQETITASAEKTPSTEAGTVKLAANAENSVGDTVGEDIKKILATIKLPERRDALASRAQHEIKKEPIAFDTTLGVVVTKPREKTIVSAPVAGSAPPARDVASAPVVNISEQVGGVADAVTRIHTLKDDLQDVVKEKKISLVRAVALEQTKKMGQEHFTRAETASQINRPRRTLMIFIVTLLVIFGGIFLYSAYSFMRVGTSESAKPQDVPLIFAENTAAFPIGSLSAVDIKRSLSYARQPNAPLGSITRITPTVQRDTNNVLENRPAIIEEFLQAIGAQVTPGLIRALSSNFFLGIHTVDENAPVLVIPVSSYERAFAGMLAWESTINADLSPLFTPVPSQTIDANGLLVDRKFQDAILHNYDIRVLRDDSGAIQLLYSFPTRAILIIAESPNSFTELLSRLRASRKL